MVVEHRRSRRQRLVGMAEGHLEPDQGSQPSRTMVAERRRSHRRCLVGKAGGRRQVLALVRSSALGSGLLGRPVELRRGLRLVGMVANRLELLRRSLALGMMERRIPRLRNLALRSLHLRSRRMVVVGMVAGMVVDIVVACSRSGTVDNLCRLVLV